MSPTQKRLYRLCGVRWRDRYPRTASYIAGAVSGFAVAIYLWFVLDVLRPALFN